MKLWIVLFIYMASFSAVANNTTVKLDDIHQPSPAKKDNKVPIINSSLLTAKESLWLDANPILSIATDHNWYPFIFIDKAGKLAGFNIDLMNLINENLDTNITVKRYTSWSAAYEQLIKGEILALFSVTPTPERKKYLDFSPVYYFTPQNILTKQSNRDIASIEDLKDKKVAVFKNHLVTQLIKNNVSVKSLHYLKTVDEVYSLLADNKIDAGVISNASAEKAKRFKLKIAGTLFNHSGNLAIASHKSQPMFSQIISKGISSISKQQMEKLTLKWSKSSGKNHFYTFDEQTYIKNHPIINVGVDSWKPILFSDKHQVFNGVIKDILSEVTRTSGLVFHPISGSQQTITQQFLDKKVDILPAIFNNNHHEDQALYTPHYLTINSSLFMKNGQPYVHSLNELAHKKLVLVENNRHKSIIKKQFPDISISYAPNANDALKLLSDGQVDALWGANAVISEVIAKENIKNIRTITQSNTLTNRLSMKVQKNTPLLL